MANLLFSGGALILTIHLGLRMTTNIPSSAAYSTWLADLKSRIQSARISATRSVNRDLILLYWDIGQAVLEKQQREGWGESVVEQLARDLRKSFPGVSGFSPRNIRDMKRLYTAYSDPVIWRQAVAKLNASGIDAAIWRQLVAKTKSKPADQLRQLVAEVPWGHNLLILNKTDEPDARLFYIQSTVRFGWSRRVLLNQIKAGAYRRSLESGKSHNFPSVMPETLADQAAEALKSSYNLEFLGIARDVKEIDLENRLVAQLRDFILELGYGFCFIGQQYRIRLGRKEYYIDLLFYHRFLKCLVALDLKLGEFAPEYAGKMDFYLNLLNEKERGPHVQPSIGIILCAEKDDLEVEFALKSKGNPIGVAEYQLNATLPRELKGKIPSGRDLSKALGLPQKKKRDARKK